jgi:hypothetical protein
MRGRGWSPFALAALLVLAGALPAAASKTGNASPTQSVPGEVVGPAVPRAQCGPDDHPETGMQGEVTAADHASGYSDVPFTCNATMVSHVGTSGGYKVERYTDAAGHDCAYYDSTLLFPINVPGSIGTYVLDMTDPVHPVQTADLITPAMLTPHESLLVNEQRGLLAAVMGNPLVAPGIVDVYDISGDCRHPVLKSVTPTGILGHESGFALDGDTFYASSLATGSMTAIDVTNPIAPVTLGIYPYSSHGLSLNDDGTRAYIAARTGAGPGGSQPGLIILDTSQVQQRVALPQVPAISTLAWAGGSVPQNAMPISVGGHPYLLEIDEFAGQPIPSGDPSAPVGAGRIIDIGDELHPKVISDLRLEVHEPENRAAVVQDPGGDSLLGGFSGHYCGVPQEVDPGIVACSMIESGLRVFDIHDPYHPKEVAYFNSSGQPGPGDPGGQAMALSRPSFVPERAEIWYADGNSGFYAVHLTNGVWGAASGTPLPALPESELPAVDDTGSTGDGSLPVTGSAIPIGLALGLLVAGLAIRRVRARA